MPGKTPEFVFPTLFSKISLEDGVVAGIGVLLFFLGAWASSPATKVICFVLAAVAAAYLVESLRPRGKRKSQQQFLEDVPQQRQAVAFEEVHSAPPKAQFEELSVSAEETIPTYAEPAKAEEKPLEFTVADYFDVDHAFPEGISEPKSEFNYLVQRVLAVVKEATFAHSVVFFWANHEARQTVVETKVTESKSFSADRKFPFGHDVVSQIATGGKPQIISSIEANAERDLVRYYTSLQDIKSFIGVPVFYPRVGKEELPVAVLAIDSKAEDAFGRESLAVLGQFTKLLSALLRTYTEKYDLLTDSELLKADKRLRTKVAGDTALSTVINTLVEEIAGLVSWDALSVVLFDETQKQWAIASVRTRFSARYVVAKQVVDFHSSIVGEAIRQNTSKVIADLSKSPDVRFLSAELALGIQKRGSFAVIPISSAAKCFGALVLESRDVNTYSAKDTSLVLHLASLAAAALELNEANDIIKQYVMVDDVTGLTTRRYLLQRLGEELERADDTGFDLSFVLVAISQLNELGNRYGKPAIDLALGRVAGVLRSSVRSYDLVGRFDSAMFGVLLVHTTANDAYVWAEKIRSTIASSVITSEQKSFSVTVSMGICGATEAMSVEECLANTLQVVEKAKEAGGNVVRVF